MEILITEWALNSYLDLKHKNVFDQNEFDGIIKPDVKLLRHYPNNIKFRSNKFWSQAVDGSNNVMSSGFKMKWHQMGCGKIQLRLPVAVLNNHFLCEAYVKSNEKTEKRKMAKF